MQAATARLEGLQKEAKALAAKASGMQQTHDAQLAAQERKVEQQLRRQQEAHEGRVVELQQMLETAQRTAAEQRADNTAESSKALALEERLAAATSGCGMQAQLPCFGMLSY